MILSIVVVLKKHNAMKCNSQLHIPIASQGVLLPGWLDQVTSMGFGGSKKTK